jgi:purine-binding chemotaxis protein CheW
MPHETFNSQPEHADASSPLVIVSFQLGPQQYGLPVSAVREVVRLPALIGLAGTGPALCGLLNLRGHYLPVLDGRILIGEPSSCGLDSQVVIVGGAQPEVGLLVDRVNAVAAFPHASRAALQPGLAGPLLAGVIDTSHDTIVLVAPATLVGLAADAQTVIAQHDTMEDIHTNA